MKINKKSTPKFPGARCLHIVSNIAHLSEELAIEICNEKIDKHQLLTYGLCVHDMDKYTEDDIERLNAQRKNEQMRLYMLYEPNDNKIAEENWVPSPEAWKQAQAEALEKFPERRIGETKPKHLHIVLSFSCSRKVDEIARWFDIEPCFVETKTGRGAVLYALRYLTHNHKGNKTEQKFVYPASIVRFRSIVPEYENLPYSDLLVAVEKKEELYDKYNASKEIINEYIDNIHRNAPRLNSDGSTGVHCRASFIEDFTYAVYLRNQKLIDAAESARDIAAPIERQVYLIGTTMDPENKNEMGGSGKSSSGKQLARDIAVNIYGADPSDDLNKQNAYIYYAGKSGAIFQRYTNQPIVVMDEITPAVLRKALGGYEGVKTFLDPHPIPEAVDIKYGDVVVNARFIIMTTIQNKDDFIRNLAGEYTDSHGSKHEADTKYIEQYERRIWAYMAFNGSDNYTLWVNKEFFPICRSRHTEARFACLDTFACDFKGVQIAKEYIMEKPLQHYLMSQMIAPLFNLIQEHEEKIKHPQYVSLEEYLSDEAMQHIYHHLGKRYLPPEPEQQVSDEEPDLNNLPEEPEPVAVWDDYDPDDNCDVYLPFPC